MVRLAVLLPFLAAQATAKFKLGAPYGDGKGNSRIIGGKPVEPPNKFSSVVSIRHGDQHFCSGTIYDKHWVITSQHCTNFKESDLPNIKVDAGIHELGSTKKDIQTVSVIEVVRHPAFARLNSSVPYGPAPYDIALLKVQPHFMHTEAVTPVNLPLQDLIITKDFEMTATAVGWGEGVKQLQEVELTLITIITCQRKYGYFVLPPPNEKYNGSWVITRAHLCTQQKEEDGKGACSSDSGGPLFAYNEEDDTYYQIGIVSAALECGKKDWPSLYTKIFKVMEWIETETLQCKARAINNPNGIPSLKR